MDQTRPNDQATRDHQRGAVVPPNAARVPATIGQPANPPERRILALLGEVRRTRRWIVPQLLRVRAFFGEVKIDLRETTIPDNFLLDVRAIGARVTLVVPPGVDVAFDVTAMLGNAISQASEGTMDTMTKRIRVAGSAVLGEVRVLVRDATE